ncbi:hypothetical protein N657DRAFT_373573 [Parathielavia appendiculata]|uniref:Uncharacterized protein n=1 Tax=Parathielavia appendiculata TaxID=2587402 RepID=A0AAN6TPT7_9PEZI|nr:hypothetical protein N657DRAFT_373573 [Parathielavia appendiculata]
MMAVTQSSGDLRRSSTAGKPTTGAGSTWSSGKVSRSRHGNRQRTSGAVTMRSRRSTTPAPTNRDRHHGSRSGRGRAGRKQGRSPEGTRRRSHNKSCCKQSKAAETAFLSESGPEDSCPADLRSTYPHKIKRVSSKGRSLKDTYSGCLTLPRPSVASR